MPQDREALTTRTPLPPMAADGAAASGVATPRPIAGAAPAGASTGAEGLTRADTGIDPSIDADEALERADAVRSAQARSAPTRSAPVREGAVRLDAPPSPAVQAMAQGGAQATPSTVALPSTAAAPMSEATARPTPADAVNRTPAASPAPFSR